MQHGLVAFSLITFWKFLSHTDDEDVVPTVDIHIALVMFQKVCGKYVCVHVCASVCMCVSV